MTETFEAVVHYSQHDDIAVLTIDAPPVNAMGVAVREGLYEACSRAFADSSVKAVVLIGANDKFIAGVDIKEFGGPRNGITLSDLQALIEQADKPVVAAIDGAIGLTQCTSHTPSCERSDFCPTRTPWQRINHAVGAALGAVSLAEMVPRPGGTARQPAALRETLTP